MKVKKVRSYKITHIFCSMLQYPLSCRCQCVVLCCKSITAVTRPCVFVICRDSRIGKKHQWMLLFWLCINCKVIMPMRLNVHLQDLETIDWENAMLVKQRQLTNYRYAVHIKNKNILRTSLKYISASRRYTYSKIIKYVWCESLAMCPTYFKSTSWKNCFAVKKLYNYYLQ